MPRLPRPQARGPLSEEILTALPGEPRDLPGLQRSARRALAAAGSSTGSPTGPGVLDDDDVQLSLTVLYELHHQGVEGVSDRWEWSPDLIGARSELEEGMEGALRAAVADRMRPPDRPEDVPAALFTLVADDDGPSLSNYLARSAQLEEFREFLMHRSLYHLKEADAHTWAVPRLSGAAKAALVEIQADEYGGGRPERMHSALFATAMRAAGVDAGYGAHVDVLPAVTLAWANSFLLLGLQRRLRGAVAGHLAALEMTSSLPNRRYGRAVRRLGLPEEAAWFFDEHVEADAVHEQIAAHDLAGRLVEAEPDLLADVFLGAAVALHTDARVGAHLLDSWAAGRSSLRDPGGVLDAAGLAGGTGGRGRKDGNDWAHHSEVA